MHKTLPSIIVVVTASLTVSGNAMAQTPPWAVGTWKGAISNMRGDPEGVDRVLIVAPNGTCKWDYLAKIATAANAKSCSFSGDSVTITTGGNSTVQLKNKGATLDGTFQTRSGNSFHVSLTKQ